MKGVYWQLFCTFFKVGLFTLGGGYAMIPMIEEQVVRRKQWLGEDDFADLLVIAQSLPGIFAVNFTVFIGYRLRKFKGAVCSALGVVLPSLVIILAFALFFHQYKDNTLVRHIFQGIRPAAVALLAIPIFNLAKNANLSWRNVWIPIVVTLLIWQVGVSSMWIILGAAICGFIYGLALRKRQRHEPQPNHNEPE